MTPVKGQMKLKQSEDFPVATGVTLYGKNTIDTNYSVFCDKYHLYTFYYD